MVISFVVPSEVLFPAASVLVITTSLSPLVFGAKDPEDGVTAPVSNDQVPSVSVTILYVAPPKIMVSEEDASAVPEITGVVSLVSNVVTVGVVGGVLSCLVLFGLSKTRSRSPSKSKLRSPPEIENITSMVSVG